MYLKCTILAIKHWNPRLNYYDRAKYRVNTTDFFVFCYESLFTLLVQQFGLINVHLRSSSMFKMENLLNRNGYKINVAYVFLFLKLKYIITRGRVFLSFWL